MTILYETKTSYHSIRVVEENSIRKLLFGSGICQEQTGVNIGLPHQHVFDYSLLAMHSLLFCTKPQRILVIGLGGGFIPMQMAHYLCNAHIDIIEIDPEVVKIAKEYFNFSESEKIKVHIGDAFDVVGKLKEKYDVIVIDAFTTNYIPFHLMTKEFHVKILELLKDKGVSAVNVCCVHPSYSSHVKTIYDVFGNNIYYLDGVSNKMTTMLFCTNGEINPVEIKHMHCHFFIVTPEKFKITDNIMNAEIFTLESMKNV